MFNCTNNYFDNESNFSKPMPWIGLYIATASLCCAILVLTDLLATYRRSQIWIPSGYFSLNASSLTVLAIATKLSVDLNTTMPRRIDQLAKISSSVLLCVSIAHFIPSLGKMRDTDMITNLIALIILIITSVVNLFIQLNTGVIYAFIIGHVALLVSMIFLMMVCCCTAIALASIKNELRGMYYGMHQVAIDELKSENGAPMTSKRLEEYLVKFSIMSHTGWPNYVLGRSILCSTCAYICCTNTVILFWSLPPSIQFRPAIFCHDENDYEWSTLLILVAQILATLIGSAVIFRKLLILPSIGKIKIQRVSNNYYKVERYWIQLLIEIRQRPFFIHIHNKGCRILVHHAKCFFCNILIAIQLTMVATIKCTSFSFKLVIYPFGAFLRRILPLINMNNLHSHSTSLSITNPSNLKQYVLHLKGEEDITESMLRSTLDATSKYIEEGKREEPAHLLDFLKASHSPGFPGVFLFDSDRVPHFDIKRPPPNCWSLPVVTLTSLAVLLPNIDPRKVKDLLEAVGEGLMFVNNIEENLNDNIHFKNQRKAADSVWEELDIYGRRFDIDHTQLASKGNNPINILRLVTDSARSKFQAFGPPKENTSIWPIEAVASYSLCKVCQTILLDCQHENSRIQTNEDLFAKLSSIICDIMGACFTNLKNSILKECSESTIENMNETARHVLSLFGRTENIMELWNGREVPHLNPDKLAFIDEWQNSSNT